MTKLNPDLPLHWTEDAGVRPDRIEIYLKLIRWEQDAYGGPQFFPARRDSTLLHAPPSALQFVLMDFRQTAISSI